MKFLCFVCRREREHVCHSLRLECCGEFVQICEEKCAEMIPRVCRGMTPEQYLKSWERVHKAVCRKKYEM